MFKFGLWIEDGDRMKNDFEEHSEAEFISSLLRDAADRIEEENNFNGKLYDFGGNKTGRFYIEEDSEL